MGHTDTQTGPSNPKVLAASRQHMSARLPSGLPLLSTSSKLGMIKNFGRPGRPGLDSAPLLEQVT